MVELLRLVVTDSGTQAAQTSSRADHGTHTAHALTVQWGCGHQPGRWSFGTLQEVFTPFTGHGA